MDPVGSKLWASRYKKWEKDPKFISETNMQITRTKYHQLFWYDIFQESGTKFLYVDLTVGPSIRQSVYQSVAPSVKKKKLEIQGMSIKVGGFN